MEKRTRVVRINHSKESPLKRVWRRHPLLYSITVTVTVMAVIAIAGALINWAVSGIPGNRNNPAANHGLVPPVVAPPLHGGPKSHADTSPRAVRSAQSASSRSRNSGSQDDPPDRATTVVEPSPAPTQERTSEKPKPYSAGSCLAGDFDSSRPKDVQQVSCSSDDAYEILASYPDETDTNVCREVEGAELAYEEEYLIDGDVVSSYVYCLGPVGQ